jgi:very-short-patch-repair endonuclease
MIAVEVDHPFWHAGEIASHADKQRDRMATAQGWRVCRITSLDVAGGLADAVADVAATIALARRWA